MKVSVAVATSALIFVAGTARAQATAASAIASADTRRASGGALARGSVLGALAGSALAMGYYFVSEKGTRSNGCQPINCALPFLTASGAIAGLFIGRELDAQNRAFAPRAGQSLDFRITEAVLLAPPNFLDVRDSLAAVVSDSGAQLLSVAPSPRALRRRANGLSDMRQVAIVPDRGTIVVGTGTALWETSLLNGPASRLVDGAVDALASSRDAILSATGTRLRWRSGVGEQVRSDSLTMPQAVTALAHDSLSASWWVATDSQLVQVSTSSGALALSATRLSLPASARAIAMNAEWIAVAMGDAGVMAWRRSTLRDAVQQPVRLSSEPRFAYDLAFLNGDLYVAGGVDGLFRIVLDPTPRVLGSSRQLPFATTVRAANGMLWVGDRTRRSVVRVTP
jgi:hypothetical protein